MKIILRAHDVEGLWLNPQSMHARLLPQTLRTFTCFMSLNIVKRIKKITSWFSWILVNSHTNSARFSESFKMLSSICYHRSHFISSWFFVTFSTRSIRHSFSRTLIILSFQREKFLLLIPHIHTQCGDDEKKKTERRERMRWWYRCVESLSPKRNMMTTSCEARLVCFMRFSEISPPLWSQFSCLLQHTKHSLLPQLHLHFICYHRSSTRHRRRLWFKVFFFFEFILPQCECRRHQTRESYSTDSFFSIASL